MSGMMPIYAGIRWWERECLNVLERGYSTDARLVRRFNPFENQTTANSIFHERQRQCSPSNSCGGNWESGNQDTCQESTNTLQQGNLPAPTWDEVQILLPLASSQDAADIAEVLDVYTWSMFCYLSFNSWMRFALGYSEPTVSEFVRGLSALRNSLAIRFQELGQPHVWILVRKVSQERNPLLRWLLDSYISENKPQYDPCAAISFILGPIIRLFSKESNGIIYVLKRLSILETRFQASTCATDYSEWQNKFWDEFTFFDNINYDDPKTHADSIMKADIELFAEVSTFDLVQQNSQQLGLIGLLWSRLCSDVIASIYADYKSSVYISTVTLYLLSLGDYHSATAILTGLHKAGINREELSSLWHLINTEDNYGAYREEVYRRGGPLILFTFPYIRLHMDTTRPDFDYPIAIAGRAASDVDRVSREGLNYLITVMGELEGRTGPDFDCPIAMAGRAALDANGGSGMPDLADPHSNDTAFHSSPRLSKHSPAILQNAPSPPQQIQQLALRRRLFQTPLDNKQRQEICQLHKDNPSITDRGIAETFGTERSTISKILKRHRIAQGLGESKEKYQQFQEGSQTQMQDLLRLADEMYTGAKPFTCFVHSCTKAYTQLVNLRIHLRHHTRGSREEQQSQEEDLLRLADDMYTGAKPFKCFVHSCTKAYTLLSSLQFHLRHHAGIHRFACPTCSLTFVRKRSLDAHIAQHEASGVASTYTA